MNILITGANRGIGLEFVRQYLNRGDQVWATARNVESATGLNETDATVVPLDVSTDASVNDFRAAIGDQSFDIVINNAGVYGRTGMLNELDFDVINRDFNVNTLGALRIMAAVRDNVRAGGAKKIVNITSKMGSIADNTSGGSYAYRISKTALNMASRCAAHEMKGEGITTIVMHPGWVQTDMGGPNALITVEQSVAGMMDVIDKVTVEQTGSFWEWNGNEVPW